MFWNPSELWNLGFAAPTVAVLVTLVAARAWGHTVARLSASAGVGASTPAGVGASTPAGVGASTPAGVGPYLRNEPLTLPALRLERPG
jgi:hypothetical protein